MDCTAEMAQTYKGRMEMIQKIAMIVGLMALSGCVPLAIGAGTETAVVVAQERSVGDAVDDAGVLLKIKNLYAKNNSQDLIFNVEVKSVEGRVLLTGNVDKPETQVDAVRLAWQVPGVKEVINEIQLSNQSGFANYAQDVWISTQVRSRLLLTKNVRSVNFSVITVNQTVYLMGIAQDQGELDRVTSVASTTGSVKRVISYVRLKDDPARANVPI